MKFRINNNLIAVGFLLLIVVGIFSFVKIIDSSYQYTSELIPLDDGWTVTYNGKEIATNKNLNDVVVPIVNEGDTFSLSRKLPTIREDSLCLYFYSMHSIVDVNVRHYTERSKRADKHENWQIYTYGRDLYSQTTEVPNKYNHVLIVKGYSEEEIIITFIGTREASFSSLSPFVIGSRVDILSYHLLSNTINLFAGVFLVVLGLILIVISPYMFLYHNKESRLFFSGLTSLLFGTYIVARFDFIDMLINNPMVNSFCEYSSFICMPISILGYIISIFRGKLKRFLKLLVIFDFLLFAGMTILHLSTIKRFSAMTSFIQGYIVSETIMVLIILVKNRKHFRNSQNRNLNSDMFFLIGVVTFIISSSIDIAMFNIHKYSSNRGYSQNYGNGFTFGAVIFVSCLLISYMFYSIYSSRISSLQERLSDFAYTDPLTGLSNRARCEQVMNVISQERSIYVIISIDLNKLKMVNDTYGHHEGDRLLTGFATILTDCFWDANLIGRMGGDEFVVIMLGEHASSCTKRIHEFHSLMSDWNRKEQVFQYSASYGYAYSYEVPNASSNEVYMLADSRMYEMKKEHHGRKEMEHEMEEVNANA